jgi:hypothetical protein
MRIYVLSDIVHCSIVEAYTFNFHVSYRICEFSVVPPIDYLVLYCPWLKRVNSCHVSWRRPYEAFHLGEEEGY